MGAAYGFDTANYINLVAPGAKSKFGTGVFYIRYENPSPAANLITSSSGVSEMRSGWDNGMRYFVPNTEPTQSRLNGTKAMGTADGQAFCAALLSIYNAVAPLDLPSNMICNCYLSLEYATNLSTSYWAGWASYVGNYQMAGHYPLYPAMYCAPNSPALNCSQTGAYWCYNVWSSTPEPCAACGPFGSAGWSAYSCYNAPGSISYTELWQMAEEGVCEGSCGRGAYPNVDADMTNPSSNETPYMMYLSFRP